MIDLSFCDDLLIDPDSKVTKTTNKTSCPSPNIQNRIMFTERGDAVK